MIVEVAWNACSLAGGATNDEPLNCFPYCGSLGLQHARLATMRDGEDHSLPSIL